MLPAEVESESESGSSDSDHEVSDSCFKITEKTRFFDGKRRLRKFVKRNLAKAGSFTSVECYGNSYDLEACEVIAKIIKTRSSEELHTVYFNNMFIQRQKTLPPSLKILIESI